MSESTLALDTSAQQASRQHITATLGVGDGLAGDLVELAVDDFNRGGNGSYQTGWIHLSRAQRKALKPYSLNQVEVAVLQQLVSHENIKHAVISTFCSPITGKLLDFRVTVHIP